MREYTIILPVLNEKDNIIKLIDIISTIFDKHNYEIIVINDSSEDGTTEILEQFKKNKKNFKHVLRNKKRSLVDSLNEAIEISKYRFLIWMDCDFSHPPENLKEIFKNIEENKFLSFSRFLNGSKRHYEIDQNSKKYFIDDMSYFLNMLCNFFLYKEFTDYTSGFICIDKKIMPEKLKGYYGDYYINLVCHVIRNKYKFVELPYIEYQRLSGESKTLSNKFDFIIKCFFYFLVVLKNYLKKIKNKIL
mgnify:CR=1 FL=1